MAAPVCAASRYVDKDNAPTTGDEAGQRHSYGPDREGRRDPRMTMSMPNDAYGNPIVPREPEEKKRVRPRAGAYGAQKIVPEKPLPDLPREGSGWKFK